MAKFFVNRLRLIAAATFTSSLLIGATPSYAQEAVRPEVGKPLQAAGAMLKSGRAREALAEVRKAESVGGRTAYENYLIERMRGSAALTAGDAPTAIRSFEAVLDSGKASPSEQLQMIEAVAGAHFRAGSYTSAITWGQRYYKQGGSGGAMRNLMTQSYFQSGDFANAAKETLADIQADEKAGRTPSEDKLLLLASAYSRQKNNTGYVATIEKLLTYHPKKSLWGDVLSRVQKKPGFSDRLALDVYRLQLATGNFSQASEYMEMSQLALQAGYGGEAKKIVDDGYTAGVLGKGAEAERHKRLRDLVDKKIAESKKALDSGALEKEAIAAKEGDALVNLGYNLVTRGDSAKGFAMMEAGIKKGNLRRPEDAKLHQGIALIQAGQKPKGVAVLKTVGGADGVQDLANLWALFAK